MRKLSFVRCNKGKYVFDRPISSGELIQTALLSLEKKNYKNNYNNPNKVADFVSLHLGHYEREVFACLFLNTKNNLLLFEKMFFGSVNHCNVAISEVAKKALKINAVGVILAHNHPAGTVSPSQEDKIITGKIKKALELFEIKLIDHVIVAGKENFSFCENGVL